MVINRTIKRAEDIKRASGDNCGRDVYNLYLKISFLELEKARRNKERDAAAKRIAMIDDRKRIIEAEKEKLLSLIEEKELANKEKRPEEACCTREAGFRIRY